MRGFQCKCGHIRGSSSGEKLGKCIRASCPKCNTTCAYSPTMHETPVPCNTDAKVSVNTPWGKLTGHVCSECHRAPLDENGEYLVYDIECPDCATCINEHQHDYEDDPDDMAMCCFCKREIRLSPPNYLVLEPPKDNSRGPF